MLLAAEEQRIFDALGDDAGFAESLKRKIDEFYKSKEVTLKTWCEKKGIDLPDGFFEESFEERENSTAGSGNLPEDLQRQLGFSE